MRAELFHEVQNAKENNSKINSVSIKYSFFEFSKIFTLISSDLVSGENLKKWNEGKMKMESTDPHIL